MVLSKIILYLLQDGRMLACFGLGIPKAPSSFAWFFMELP